jgi:hypothetical protein
MRWIAPLAALTLSCGQPAATPAPSSSSSASASTSTPTSTSAATPDPEPSPSAKKPLAVNSQCANVVQVVFGDDPKGPAKRSIAQSGTIDAPRRPDGTQVVWLLDDQGEGIVKVTVTRHMKRVDIGRSCSTMDAH